MNRQEIVNVLNKAIEIIENSTDYLGDFEAVVTVEQLKKIITELPNINNETSEKSSNMITELSTKKRKESTTRDIVELVRELHEEGLLDEEDKANIKFLQKADINYVALLGLTDL